MSKTMEHGVALASAHAAGKDVSRQRGSKQHPQATEEHEICDGKEQLTVRNSLTSPFFSGGFGAAILVEKTAKAALSKSADCILAYDEAGTKSEPPTGLSET